MAHYSSRPESSKQVLSQIKSLSIDYANLLKIKKPETYKTAVLLEKICNTECNKLSFDPNGKLSKQISSIYELSQSLDLTDFDANKIAAYQEMITALSQTLHISREMPSMPTVSSKTTAKAALPSHNRNSLPEAPKKEYGYDKLLLSRSEFDNYLQNETEPDENPKLQLLYIEIKYSCARLAKELIRANPDNPKIEFDPEASPAQLLKKLMSSADKIISAEDSDTSISLKKLKTLSNLSFNINERPRVLEYLGNHLSRIISDLKEVSTLAALNETRS